MKYDFTYVCNQKNKTNKTKRFIDIHNGLLVAVREGSTGNMADNFVIPLYSDTW